MIPRDLAQTWVHANCRSADVRRDFLKHLEDALRLGVGCSFIVGCGLTKSMMSYMVYCYCGEFFAFQLTLAQAEQLNANGRTMVGNPGLRPQNHDPRPEPLVQLRKVEVDHAERMDGVSSIDGSISLFSDQFWDLPVAIQSVCEPPSGNSVILYHHLDQLPRGLFPHRV